MLHLIKMFDMIMLYFIIERSLYMQGLFNWSMEEYDEMEFIKMNDLESANPVILKHKFKFKEMPIHMYDSKKQLFMNGTMFFRYDGFKFDLYDKTVIAINLKYIPLTIIDKNDYIIINNGHALQFRNNEDKQEFIDYFNSYNETLNRINKSLCDTSFSLYKELSLNDNIKNAINNLIDMLPQDFFLSGEAFYMLLMKLCIMDVKFNAFLDTTLSEENNITEALRLNYSDICKIIDDIVELQDIYALITQFNELISSEYKTNYSYMYILTYLLLLDEITDKFSNAWKSETNISYEFISDEDYIKYCYENNLIISEDDGFLGCLAYYLRSKSNSYDFLLKNSVERIKNILDELKSNTQKKIFAKNIFKDRTQPAKKEDITITIDDIDLMTGFEFEEFISILFNKMGYSAKITKGSGDQGIDVIAEKNGVKIGIQCKCYANAVSNSAIQEVVAGKQLYQLDKLIVITNNYFTKSAQELAKANNVILWDREILKEKLNNYCAGS